MRSPLGQLLLREKLITKEQLEAALDKRHEWGSRVGSSLVRLGILDLDTLARILSVQFGVPAAFERDFQNIQQSALSRIPRRLAEKHLAVPLAIQYRETARTLSLALPDPDAVAVIDELAFAAGMKVTVNVAPELRLLRFVNAQSGLDFEPGPQHLPYATPSAEPAPSGPPSELWLGEDAPKDDVFSWRELLARPKSDPPSHDPLTDDSLPEILLENIVDEIKNELEAPLSLTLAVGLLGQAKSRDEVGERVLRFARGRFDAGMLLVVAEGAARGWRGFSQKTALAPMGQHAFPLSLPSCLRAAYDRRTPLRGPPPREGALVHSQLWKSLRCDPPREVVVAPLLLGPRVAALVYAHSTSQPVPDLAVDELAHVCAAAATALVRLVGT